jgi:hypothetical protein
MVLYENLSICEWCGYPFLKGNKVKIEMIVEVEYKGEPNIEFPLDAIKVRAYHNDTKENTTWNCYKHHRA